MKIVLLCLFLLTWVSRGDAWVASSQPFPEGEATVVLHLFCRDDGVVWRAQSGTWAIVPIPGWEEVPRCEAVPYWIWQNLILNALGAWNGAGADFVFHHRIRQQDDDPCQPKDGEVHVILATPATLCPGDGAGGLLSGRAEKGTRWARIYLNAEEDTLVLSPEKFADDLLVHELGHVVGLGHPDEHGQDVLAVMNSEVRSYPDGLAPDDIDGIRALYGEAPNVDHPPWCLPPDPHYCVTRVCEAGEGDCDPGQCADGLTCVNDIGIEYGLPAYYDVCEVIP